MIIKIILFYWQTVFISGVLLIFRDDIEVILKDIKKGFSISPLICLIHIIFIILLLPFSVPFSLVRIFKKWF